MTTNVRVIATDAFHAGGEFLGDFDALGYPVKWHQNEIRELPVELWQKLSRMPHTPLSVEAETLQRFEQIQPRFEMLNRRWREERDARRAKVKNDGEEVRIQEEVNRLLAIEQAAKIAKLRAIARKNLNLPEE